MDPRLGISNWGRWGEEDERGAANLLTPDLVLRAMACVRRGLVIELGAAVGKDGPISGARNQTWRLTMKTSNGEGGIGAAEDVLTMHTHAHSHLDGLAHLWYNDRLYNKNHSDVVNRGGAGRLGVDKLGPLVGRGILLDVSDLEDWGAGSTVESAHLQIALDRIGQTLESGDCVLVRTGWFDHWKNGEREKYQSGEPGLAPSAVRMIAQADPALLGMDNFGIEPIPAAPGMNPRLSHEVFLRDLGAPLLENLDLRELAIQCSAPFLFAASTLKITKGLGSPINPMAIL